jgi:hypothetical protein
MQILTSFIILGEREMRTGSSEVRSTKSVSQGAPKTFYVFDPDAIQPGDILLTRAPSAISLAIRKVTKTEYSHAAICIDYGHFIEAIGSGVCRFNVMAVGVRDRTNIRLLRLNRTIPNAAQVAGTAAEHAHQDLLRGYTALGAVGVVVPSPKKPDEAALFCSQLVVEAYDKVPFSLLPGKKAKKIAPGHLVDSPSLEDVTDPALRQVISTDDPTGCLDDPHPKQRLHLWEVITKLKMLGRKSIQRAAERLNANPRSFYEIELLLRDTKDQELDRVIVAALEATKFCETYDAKASEQSDREERFANSMHLVKAAASGRLSSSQLSNAITETKQAIRMFEEDLEDRRKQHSLYVGRSIKAGLKSFSLLGDLQRKCISRNQEILTLLKGQLSALEKTPQQ